MQQGRHLDTPLHAAAQQASTDIVSLLLDFGADINTRNIDFKRPVDVAVPRSPVERQLLLYEGEHSSDEVGVNLKPNT